MAKKLRLSSTDKKIAGVCGGFAARFGISSTIIRIILLLLMFCYGIGLLAYLICWLIMPRK